MIKGIAFGKFINHIDIDLFVYGGFGNLYFVHSYMQ